MASQMNRTDYGIFTQILRRSVALGLCTTMLPFAQLNVLAQNAPPPQQSQYPYQDPGSDPAGQPQDGYGQAGYGQQGGYYDGQGGQGGYQDAPNAYQPQGPQQLEQLVAPIALYPDSLVAQVLAASTYPQQVQEASGWMQQYGNQSPEQLASSVNAMPWDPSVKALTQFPSVLQQLARSSQWTVALGNAYYNQPADVMAAVQSMRFRAREAGQLRDTPQQVIVDDGPQIIIQPANPDVVYVPYYDPWVCYGAPVTPYYGWYRPAPPVGLAIGVGIGFGIGIGLAAFGHWGWGYHAWAPNWHSNTIIVNHNTYISNSTTVINRGGYGSYNQGFGRGGPQNFSRASFNARTPLYNGRPVSAENRPALNNGNLNRPGAQNTLSRPNQPGNFNQPGSNAGNFNRPGGQNTISRPNQPGNFNQPGGNTGNLNRPGGQNTVSRPNQPGNFNQPGGNAGGLNRAPNAGTYNQPSGNGAYSRPAQGANPYARPSGATGGPVNGGYNRPSAAPNNAYRPAPSTVYNRPAPGGGSTGAARPQVQAAPHAPSQSHTAPAAPRPQGGGEHHGGGGEHHGEHR